jgi:hypothetical protein
VIQDPLELPFDQYQRYRVVADLVPSLREGSQPLTILDVGGRTANLRAFLPEDRVYIVDVEPSDEPGLVLGDGGRLPYRDKCVDVVAAFDTLEHVPPAHRAAFVAECARVARKWVVLAGPYAAPAVDESERLLQRFLRDKLGVEHRYLDEHRHNGLPDLARSRAGLEAAGMRTAAIGHGNLERWLPLMCLSLYLDHEPELRELAKAVFRFYNGELYASDHAEPVYRHALIGAAVGAPLPTAVPGLAAPRAPAGTLGRFDEVIGELAGFDRARAVWSVERERLWEMARTLEQDLAGHRDTLTAERELRADASKSARALERELAEHRVVLDTTRTELAQSQSGAERMRAHLDGELALVRAALTAAERAREEDRSLRARLENDAARALAEATALRADLKGHQDVLATERAELAATRTVLAAQQERARGLEALLDGARRETAAREAELVKRQGLLDRREVELAGLRATIAALESDLAGHRESLRVTNADLAGHRGALQDVRAEAERLRADLETALHERNVEGQRLEGAHAELAKFARILQEQDRKIASLRGDLRSRAKSLRRALGPKPPIE